MTYFLLLLPLLDSFMIFSGSVTHRKTALFAKKAQKEIPLVYKEPIDEIFGSEFNGKEDEFQPYNWRGKTYKALPPEKREKVMKGYDNIRISLVLDSLFVSAIGLSIVWYFGTYKDGFSYEIGALLGAGYTLLLGRYVESIGGGGRNVAGSLRFAPVILLVLLYSKNKGTIQIIPEVLGFFSFQLSSLLQIFNEGAYTEDNSN